MIPVLKKVIYYYYCNLKNSGFSYRNTTYIFGVLLVYHLGLVNCIHRMSNTVFGQLPMENPIIFPSFFSLHVINGNGHIGPCPVCWFRKIIMNHSFSCSTPVTKYNHVSRVSSSLIWICGIVI